MTALFVNTKEIPKNAKENWYRICLGHCFLSNAGINLWPFLDNGRSAIWLNGHKYDRIECLFKGMEKSRSGQKKFDSNYPLNFSEFPLYLQKVMAL